MSTSFTHPKLTYLQFSNIHPHTISKFASLIHLCILCTLLSLSIFIFFTAFLGSVESQVGSVERVTLPVIVDGIELRPIYHAKPAEHRKRTKFFFMLIDAMRYDMVSGENPNMPFLSRKIRENKVVFMKAKSEPPTVTLPRLKALTTGMKPVFLDILKNVEDQTNPDKYAKLMFDNWLRRFHEGNASVVMCGDATWQNLFPTEYFTVIDPTTSLYVHDTVEVDVNVTRNLDWILDAEGRLVHNVPYLHSRWKPSATSTPPEWNVTILHYLGLDHVGHVGGIYHSLMAPKQREMDQVIERIYTWMMQREQDDVVFVVGSDHGMNADGNHGGATDEEVDSYFAFMSKTYDTTPGTAPEYDTVAQRDLVPTLSSLFSIPIPELSIGRVIEPVITRMRDPNLLTEAYTQNAQQIVLLLLNTPDLWRFIGNKQMPVSDSVKHLLELYARAFTDEDYKLFIDYSVELLLQKSSKIHQDMIVLAWCGFAIAALALTLNGWDLYSRVRFQFQYCYLSAFFILASHLIYNRGCAWWGAETEICSPQNYFTVALVIITASFAAESALIGARNRLVHLKQWWSGKSNHARVTPKSSSFVFYMIGSPLLFQLVSLTSSSLIEEEHLIWYYACATCMVCALFYSLRQSNQVMTAYCAATLALFTLARLWNQSGIKYRSDIDFFKLLSKWDQESSIPVSAYTTIASILIYCVYEIYAFWFSPTSLWLRIHMAQPLNTQTLLLLMANLFIILYKVGAEILHSSSWYVKILLPQLTYMSLLLMLLVTVVFIPIRENILVSSTHVLTRILSAFISLQFILQKSENAPLIVCIILLCFFTFRFVRQGRWNISHPIELIMFCHSMGMATFYMFGNSISISSIDFSGAYTGFSSFQQEIIGCFIISMVYCGPIAFDLTTVVSLTNRDLYHTVSQFALFKLTLRALTMLLFSVVIYAMRNHLFIWSVFSPKLLHESFLSLYTLGGVMLLSGFITCAMAYYNDSLQYKVGRG